MLSLLSDVLKSIIEQVKVFVGIKEKESAATIERYKKGPFGDRGDKDASEDKNT